MSGGQGKAGIWVMNGTGTSAGNGPGYFELPAREAASLVRRRLAVYGTAPPASATHMPAATASPEARTDGMSDHAEPSQRQHLPQELTPADADWWKRVG